MGKNGKVVSMASRDRNNKFKAWQSLVPVEIVDNEAGIVAAFQNNRCLVNIKQVDSSFFRDESGNPMKMAQLIIRMFDGGEPSYDEKRRIKGELCHPNAEAVELIPGAWRDITEFKQTHLWVLPLGASYPLGMVPHDFDGKMESDPQSSASSISKDDVQVYVVKCEEVFEVFANDEEAKEAYEKNGSVIGDGEFMNIGDVPVDDEKYVWSDAAKVKVSNLVAAISSMQPEFKVDPYDNPQMIEDEIVDGAEDGPFSIEDGLELADVMKKTVEERSKVRDEMIKQVSEISNDAVEDAKAEMDAAQELIRMREEMVKSKDGQN